MAPWARRSRKEGCEGLNDLSGSPGAPNLEAKKPDPGQDLSQVVACTAEHCVDRIALHALEEVPSEEAIRLHMANLRLHCGPSPEMAFEGVTELAGATDEHLTSFFRNPVSFVPAIHEGGSRDLSSDPLDLVELAVQGVTVEGVARAGLDADYEAFLVGNGQAYLYAEFVGLVRLALGDALHFGSMQAVDLPFGGALLGKDQLSLNHRTLVRLEGCIAHFTFNISHHPTRHGLDTAEHLPGTLELLGLRMPTVFLEGSSHQLSVALA